MIITISGTAGSGKSTLAKKLEEALGFPRIYVGGIRRAMAQEKGMTLAEFNEWSQTNSEGDVPVDTRVQEEARKLDNAIVEGRVMYHFLPESLKIFVDANLDVAAERIFHDMQTNDRNEGANLTSVEAVKQSIIERQQSDNARYKKYYGIDVFNHKNYDFVIDSSTITAQEIFEKTLAFIQDHQK